MDPLGCCQTRVRKDHLSLVVPIGPEVDIRSFDRCCTECCKYHGIKVNLTLQSLPYPHKQIIPENAPAWSTGSLAITTRNSRDSGGFWWTAGAHYEAKLDFSFEGVTVLGKKFSPPGFLAITRYHSVGEVPGSVEMVPISLPELPKPSRTLGKSQKPIF